MNKLLIALLLAFTTAASFAASPNLIVRQWDWNVERSPAPLNTVDNGGFPAGSVISVQFKAAYTAIGGASAAPYPPGTTEHGCVTTTSISERANDFDKATAVLVRTGGNQGIQFQAGGKQVVRKGKAAPLVAPLEVGKQYYLNFKAVGEGCGDYRFQYNAFPV